MTDSTWIRSYNGKGVVAGGFYHSSYGSSEYVLTTDATIIPGKLYYRRVEAGASARTGNTTRTKQYGVYYYIAF